MKAFLYSTLFCLCVESLSAVAAGPSIESARLRVELRDDLNGFTAITNKQSGRNFAAADAKPAGLYRLHLGRKPGTAGEITSLHADRRSSRTLAHGFELRFEHAGSAPLKVILRAMVGADGSSIRWKCQMQNSSKEAVTLIEFPRANCTVQLGASADDDGVVYPNLEGALLTNPSKNMTERGGVAGIYPGPVSAQFMYFFDPASGFYCAALDSQCHTKTLNLKRSGNALLLGFGHCAPDEPAANLEIPYEIMWACGGGRWEDGAELYRSWAERQPWCAKKLVDRDIPAWLKRANVFLNFVVTTAMADPKAADRLFSEYHEFFQVPVVACAFGWEKFGPWIGPDFFPPVNSESYYRELTRLLAQRGDHMQVYTSGFRWGVKKTIRERTDQGRQYTDYDGTAKFMKEGKAASAIDAEGKMIFKQPAWADNYILCTGSEAARSILAECFQCIYGWGVAGVDVDQNLGGEVSECFSKQHGHPAGRGVWQYRVMAEFLTDLRARIRPNYPDSLIGVEEPCEAYAQLIDIYHGRIFTDTRWPVNGPGAVSIPLYVYLYHAYQPGYAGWIDAGFSPFGREKYGLGRAFIFGMLPGVRLTRGGGLFDLERPQISDELKILRNIARLQAFQKDSLILGRMLPAPNVKGSPNLVPLEGSLQRQTRRGDTGAAQKRTGLPIPWPVVQATAWQAVDGKTICYAFANLSDQAHRITLGLIGKDGAAVTLERKGYSLDQEIKAKTTGTLPMDFPLEVQPWEVLVLVQTGSGT